MSIHLFSQFFQTAPFAQKASESLLPSCTKVFQTHKNKHSGVQRERFHLGLCASEDGWQLQRHSKHKTLKEVQQSFRPYTAIVNLITMTYCCYAVGQTSPEVTCRKLGCTESNVDAPGPLPLNNGFILFLAVFVIACYVFVLVFLLSFLFICVCFV